MSSIERQVVAFIAARLGVQEEGLAPETSIIHLRGVDSLDAVEMLIALEDEFGVEIPDEAAAQITTVQDLIECLTVASGRVQQNSRPFPTTANPKEL